LLGRKFLYLLRVVLSLLTVVLMLILLLQNVHKSLEKPVAVSVADANAQLKVAGTMEIPIQWKSGKENTFQMLVVPGLSWRKPLTPHTSPGGSC